MVGLIGYYLSSVARSEEEQLESARQLYKSAKYEESANAFDSLAKGYPGSAHLDEYFFYHELSRISNHAQSAQADPEEILRQLDKFVKDFSRNPIFDSNRPDVLAVYILILGELANDAKSALSASNLEQARQLHAAGLKARETLPKLGSKESETAPIDQQLASIGLGIDKLNHRLQSLAELEKLDPNLDDLRRARQIVRTEGLQGEVRAEAALKQIQDGIIRNINYVPAERRLNPLRQDDVEPSILMAVAELPSVAPRSPGEEIVFALARGVLYALGAKSSELYWAARVGQDTMTLPVRVAATESTPEIALVLSSDNDTLVAREVQSGTPRWQYDLPAPCLGRPVLVGQTAYVATKYGLVHEIEVISGRVLGSYVLHAPLSGFGTYSQNLLYLPAESMGVFVLDLESKRCTGLLETDHASGSVRGEPVIVGSQYLVLSQADGLRQTALAAYRLKSIVGFTSQPPEAPVLRFDGWSWFAPAYDGEKLSMVTDRGVLQVFGVWQENNQDKPIFSMFNEQPSSAHASIENAERGQIVHADEHNFWALVNGELARYELAWDRPHGLRLLPTWHHPLAIGSPIQASQTAGSTDVLVMVTQSDSECLATAVTAQAGQVLWQRRLGLVCRGEPRVAGRHLVTVDHGGAMASFVRGSELPAVGREWRQGGNNIFKPLSRITSGPFVLEDRKPSAIWEIATAAKAGTTIEPADSEVVLRRYDDSADQGNEQRFPIPDRIQGTPAIGATDVWLPLRNGEIYQQPLANVGRPTGVSWQSDTSSNAQGHLVLVDDAHLVSTDGQRTLRLWQLPAGGGFPQKLKEKKLPARIATPPILLPGAGDKARLCLVDERGVISLLEPTSLGVIRNWSSGGSVSAGPFVRGGRLLCILGQERLISIDPEKEGLMWAAAPTSHAIVGEPVQIGDGYLLADESGLYTMIDASTGRPRGRSPQVRGSLGPAATPVAYSDDRIFAPLTDGTFMLLRLDGGQQAKR
jgi:hypothetical protein